MQDVWVISACRTAIGKLGGSLVNIPVCDLGCIVIKEAIIRAQVDYKMIEEVIMGHAIQAGTGQGATRVAAVKAGIPEQSSAYSVNNVCGSGLRAINIACALISSEQNNLIVAGGMENMSQAPHLLPSMRFGRRNGNSVILDSIINDGLTDSFEKCHMGLTAEKLARKYEISRYQQDEYAVTSQNRVENAVKRGLFKSEIVPVCISEENNMYFTKDEYYRENVTIESISSLTPVFCKKGTVTAANASGINDGAAAVVIGSSSIVHRYNLRPLAKIIGCVSVGVEHEYMGLGAAVAIKKVLKLSNLQIEDIDLFEINEAFSAQILAVQKELDIDFSKININGGAIALGHPIGASGARIFVTLLNNLLQIGGKYGIASICVGGGMGVATLIEMV